MHNKHASILVVSLLLTCFIVKARKNDEKKRKCHLDEISTRTKNYLFIYIYKYINIDPTIDQIQQQSSAKKTKQFSWAVIF